MKVIVCTLTDAEKRKHRYQIGLETLVVYALKDECSCLEFLNT